jgi:hypothetical protein
VRGECSEADWSANNMVAAHYSRTERGTCSASVMQSASPSRPDSCVTWHRAGAASLLHECLFHPEALALSEADTSGSEPMRVSRPTPNTGSVVVCLVKWKCDGGSCAGAAARFDGQLQDKVGTAASASWGDLTMQREAGSRGCRRERNDWHDSMLPASMPSSIVIECTLLACSLSLNTGRGNGDCM